MSDIDRLLDSTSRMLEDGCLVCGFSKVYCRAVAYIEGGDASCCGPTCSH